MTDRLCLVAVTALWVFSLVLPAVVLGEGIVLSGWELLRSGWRAGSEGVLGWYANPLFFLTLVAVLRGRDRLAIGLAAAALLTATSSFTARTILSDRGPGIEALTWGSGFFVWFAAIAALLPWTGLRRTWRARAVSARVPQ